MKKMKIYCIGMLIVGGIFISLIVCAGYSNDTRKEYNYTTSGEQIQATDIK